MILSGFDVSDSETTGLILLLPMLEQDNTYRIYHFEDPWWDPANFDAVAVPVKLFYCPSNRSSGWMDLTPIGPMWGYKLPPRVAACDYALCRGANGALNRDWTRIPPQVRGLFNIRQPGQAQSGVRLTDIQDGTSATMAMGDAAGGNGMYQVADLNNPTQPAIDPLTKQPALAEQAWGAAGVSDAQHPWYTSLFAVTAQYGLAPDPRDEPMNRRPVTPTAQGGDPRGDNARGRDFISGFRSLHPGGCNFLYGDGSVHFLAQSIPPAVYRALSTYAGGEVAAGN
jgi:prepilin-type processing-associated H-X9-DG protein